MSPRSFENPFEPKRDTDVEWSEALDNPVKPVKKEPLPPKNLPTAEGVAMHEAWDDFEKQEQKKALAEKPKKTRKKKEVSPAQISRSQDLGPTEGQKNQEAWDSYLKEEDVKSEPDPRFLFWGIKEPVNTENGEETSKTKNEEKPPTEQQETISDEEYRDFLTSGKIPSERLITIAEKIISNKKLSAREGEIRAQHSKSVEELLIARRENSSTLEESDGDKEVKLWKQEPPEQTQKVPPQEVTPTQEILTIKNAKSLDELYKAIDADQNIPEGFSDFSQGSLRGQYGKEGLKWIIQQIQKAGGDPKRVSSEIPPDYLGVAEKARELLNVNVTPPKPPEMIPKKYLNEKLGGEPAASQKSLWARLRENLPWVRNRKSSPASQERRVPSVPELERTVGDKSTLPTPQETAPIPPQESTSEGLVSDKTAKKVAASFKELEEATQEQTALLKAKEQLNKEKLKKALPLLERVHEEQRKREGQQEYQSREPVRREFAEKKSNDVKVEKLESVLKNVKKNSSRSEGTPSNETSVTEETVPTEQVFAQPEVTTKTTAEVPTETTEPSSETLEKIIREIEGDENIQKVFEMAVDLTFPKDVIRKNKEDRPRLLTELLKKTPSRDVFNKMFSDEAKRLWREIKTEEHEDVLGEMQQRLQTIIKFQDIENNVQERFGNLLYSKPTQENTQVAAE